MNEIKYPNEYAVWDLETSGLNKATDKILEIGLAIVKDGEIHETHSWLLNNGITISEETTKLTGITQEMIDADGYDPKEALTEFFAIFDAKKPHLTHNGMRFDIPFLAEQSMKIFGCTIGKWEELTNNLYGSSIDSAVLMKAKKLELPRMWNESFKDYADRVMEIRAFGVKYNVSVCCDDLGIDKSAVTMHRALGDVELTHQIYQRMIFPTI